MTHPKPSEHAPKLNPIAACIAIAILAGTSSATLAIEPAPTGAAHTTAAATTAYQLRMQQHLARSRSGITALQRSAPAPTGQTRVVTSCADDADPGTLRNIIGVAGEGDIIDLSQLGCSMISLVGGPIDMSVLGPNHLYDLTLQGPSDRTLTIDGSQSGRILQHGGYATGTGALNIYDLTLANATATGGLATCVLSFASVNFTRSHASNCHSSSGSPLNFGGAISASGDLVLTDSTITNSSSSAPGNAAAVGGGADSGYSITLVNSTVSGNTVSSATGGSDYATGGGGLYVAGPLTLIHSTLSGNHAGGGGASMGGGALMRGSLLLQDSTVDNNTADGSGGGLFKTDYTNYGDNLTSFAISNTTISGNRAPAGAGLATTRPGTIANSTIAFNRAGAVGGGVLFQPGAAPSVAFNLQSALIANNEAPLAADLGTQGPLTVTGANNLILVTDDSIALPPDTLYEDDPQLEPLADNGGPTRTHALVAGSPAIDAGNNAGELEYDQRGDGFARVAGASADIGAFELQAKLPDDTIFRNGFDGSHVAVLPRAGHRRDD